VLLFALLSACAPLHQVGKFLAPPDYVLPAEERTLATATYASGWAREEPRAYDPESFGPVDQVRYERPVPITVDGWVELAPLAEGESATVWVRHDGLVERDFRPVANLTGALPDRLPDEIRFLPDSLPLRVSIGDLANPYAGEPIEDGDLVLLAVRGADGHVEHYVFRTLDFGFRARFGAGLLIRIPLEGDEQLAPALAASVALGYRPRTRQPGLSWVAEQLALVGSVGVGSTETGVSTLSGALNAALLGGGVQVFGFVSGQVLVNVSSFLREADESSVALAVGFDAVQFARFTERAGPRLFSKNELAAPPPPPPPGN
jgi:hypothetical protein